MDKEFESLLATCTELAIQHPESIVFIGGVAVYLHAVNGHHADLAETTHDGDFYISIAEMSALRDTEDVVPNKRLRKHQITRKGFDFDIYTERHSALIVPYDDVSAHAISYGEVAVAAPEHLLALKLDAYRDRRESAKGAKDAADLVRICLLTTHRGSNKFDASMAAKYLTSEHVELFRQVARSPVLTALARGNAKVAKGYRERVSKVADSLESEYQPPPPGPPASP